MATSMPSPGFPCLPTSLLTPSSPLDPPAEGPVPYPTSLKPRVPISVLWTSIWSLMLTPNRNHDPHTGLAPARSLSHPPLPSASSHPFLRFSHSHSAVAPQPSIQSGSLTTPMCPHPCLTPPQKGHWPCNPSSSGLSPPGEAPSATPPTRSLSGAAGGSLPGRSQDTRAGRHRDHPRTGGKLKPKEGQCPPKPPRVSG